MASNQFAKIFRHANGQPVVGKGNSYFSLQRYSGGDHIYMTESSTVKGLYYCTITSSNKYFICKGGVIDYQLSGQYGIYLVVA